MLTEAAKKIEAEPVILEDLYYLMLDKGREEGLEKGLAKGREEGLAPLVHQFERRLRRRLSDEERHALAARLDCLGPDRLGDVVLDLKPKALAAWLADPEAK